MSRPKPHTKECVSEIEVVGVHKKVAQEVISIGLRDVAAIEVKRKEHDKCPKRHTDVYFPDNTL